MIDDFYVDVNHPPFYVEVIKIGEATHFTMLGNLNQVLFYAVADPRVKENAMSHAEVTINDRLDFLLFGAVFSDIDDAFSMLQDTIETLLNTMKDGVKLRNSRGFLVLHRKPRHLGRVAVDREADKFIKKKLYKMCTEISNKFRDCVSKKRQQSDNLIPIAQYCNHLGLAFYRYGIKNDLRDVICQKLEPAETEILKNLDKAVGIDVTSKGVYDRSISKLRSYVAYQEDCGWYEDDDGAF